VSDSRPAPVNDPRLEGLAAGDHAAFESLFREYHAPLCAFADRVVAAPDVAEEIVQDVFASLWRTRSTLRIRTSLRAYLYTAVRNRALNHARRSGTESVLDAAVSMDASAGAEPDALVQAAETAEIVASAIASLPPRCREVITLRWVHGLSHAEIAEIMSVSVKAVENQVTRGLRTLRGVLDARSL
jgi:RNA polymerase sigma-19 factor, ECF subfamily